jgi:hypothetical protein
MLNRIKNTADSLLNRRQGISPSVDRFLDEHGNEQIVNFVISRNIISPLITGTLNILSPNFKKKTNNLPLYHLKILIKTDRTSLSLEKNERITISRYQMNKNAENMNVNIPNGLSLNILLDRTKQLMGGKFLTYSAYNNNCGDMVLAILQSNNLSTSQNVLFTKQATQRLFTPQLRKITNTITDIAGKVNIIRQGGDIKKKNPWVKHVQEFAKENNIGFFKALSDPKCKASYRRVIGEGANSSSERVVPVTDDNLDYYYDKNGKKINRKGNNNIHTKMQKQHIKEERAKDLQNYLNYDDLNSAQRLTYERNQSKKERRRNQVAQIKDKRLAKEYDGLTFDGY